MRKSSLVIGFGLVVLGGALWRPSAVFAATTPSGGITMTPFEQNLTLSSADDVKSFNLTLKNNTSSLQELDLKSQDFGSLNDTGGILLEGSNSYTEKYGLVSWMTLGTDTVVLKPGDSQVVPVTITNRTSLQPGGHYGAVVVSVNSLNDQSGNHVVINQRLLSLVLVNKVGGEHYSMKLDGVSANGNWLHLPNTVKLHFQNDGNTHVVPRGIVTLKSPSGTVLARGIINSESAFILPQSFRDLYVPLTKVGSSIPLPGVYQVEVQFRYDGISQYATKHVAVKFIDLKGFAALIIVLYVVYRVWKWRRRQMKRPAKAAGTARDEPLKISSEPAAELTPDTESDPELGPEVSAVSETKPAVEEKPEANVESAAAENVPAAAPKKPQSKAAKASATKSTKKVAKKPAKKPNKATKKTPKKS